MAADREQLVAVRLVHRVNHDFMRRAVCIRNRQGLLVIECRVALVAVKLGFVMVGDRPDQSFNACALFGQNCQVAAPERQLIALQLGDTHGGCLRAAVGHLLKIQIGAIGKVFFFRHFFSYLASSVRGRGCLLGYSDLSCRHALSPGRFFSRCIRTFLYSGPISPSRSRKVRKVNAGLSPMGVFRNCVYFWLMPCAEIAIARMMFALASPAWSVELNRRHSIVP